MNFSGRALDPDLRAGLAGEARAPASFGLVARLAARIVEAPLVSVTVGSGSSAPVRTWAGDPGMADRLLLTEQSLCQRVIDSGQRLIVDVACREPSRLAESADGITWAGFPVRGAGGYVAGALCVADHSARHWTSRDLDILEMLAQVASSEPGLAASSEPGHGRAAPARPPLPALPKIARLQVSVRSISPRTRVDREGDFSDVFPLADGQLALAVGNVRCTEPSVARQGALARFALSAAAQTLCRPSMVLTGLNQALLAGGVPEQILLSAAFATVRATVAGILLRISSAGHALALLRRVDGEVQALGQPGAPLGLHPAPELHDDRATLKAGDSLILVTGSIVDARGKSDGQPFGAERLSQVVAGLEHASATRMAGAVLGAVREFSGGEIDHPALALALKVPGGKWRPGSHSRGWPGSHACLTVDHQVPDA